MLSSILSSACACLCVKCNVSRQCCVRLNIKSTSRMHMYAVRAALLIFEQSAENVIFSQIDFFFRLMHFPRVKVGCSAAQLKL